MMWMNGGAPVPPPYGAPPPPGHPLHGLPHPAYPPGHPLHMPVMAMGPGGPHPGMQQMVNGMPVLQVIPNGAGPHQMMQQGPSQSNGNHIPQRGRPPGRAEGPNSSLVEDKAKKQRKASKGTPQKRPEEMNVSNGMNQASVNLTPAQLQNLQNLGINPAQFAMMGLQLQNGVIAQQHQQPTTANMQVAVSAQQPVVNVQAPMIAHPPVPQPQAHQLTPAQAQQIQAAQQQAAQQAAQQAIQQAAQQAQQQQQQQQQQATVQTPQQQHQQQQVQQQQQANPQTAQLLQQFQAVQAAQAAQTAQAAAQQQLALQQQLQQAQLVNSLANPPCPPPPPGIPSMPWPMSTPVCHIPYFDMNLYRSVNIEAPPSHDNSGMDLPLTDITTLRFFFNLGVQQSRNLMTARQHQAAQQSQQAQQQHQQNPNEVNLAVLAAQGGNANNLLALVNSATSGGQVPNQGTIDQLHQLIGQHNVLRQAQQLQGPQVQQHMLQQQIGQLLAAQRNQQQQQQLQQQQMQQQANQNAMQSQLQQQINAILAQQQQEQQRQQQQQNVQNAQIAAAANAAAVELVNATGQPVNIGGGATFVSGGIQQQPATTPIPPAATPNSQQQQIQKHFDGQTLLLQQALLQHANSTNNTGNKATLHDIRFQVMAQQQQQVTTSGAGPSNLHPFIRPSEAVRAAAANGGEPTLSPRPIPLDPSPPRATSGGSVNLTAEQQKDTVTVDDEKASSNSGPSTSSSTAALTLSNPIGIANPLSVSAAGFHNSKPTTAVSGNGNPGSSGATPVLSIIQMSEDHFTDTFRKTEQKLIIEPVKMRQPGQPSVNGQANGSPKVEPIGDHEERPPALAPILMMSYLNNCMSHAKTHLTANGVQVGVDDNGQVVDFSSRPIDPIFKDAREDMKAKDVRNLEHGVKRPYPGPTTPNGKSTKKSPSPQHIRTSSNSSSPLRNPLGINRSIPDAVLPPKLDAEHDRSPEDDSEDDGAKRLRIATDEE
ncbi:unnamed protein product [Caenorhabditis sp. 36 PRJEB53466]|nr:unnamed protein product [Caenorhabditis sp. 36 PRJEB53466]